MIRAISGRPVDDITLEGVRWGEIGPEDIRIHPETLQHQAEVAGIHANPQLAENLLRAAELAQLDDERILRIYEALRPRRSRAVDLESIAEDLDADGATRCAQLVREALDAYAQRGLLA